MDMQKQVLAMQEELVAVRRDRDALQARVEALCGARGQNMLTSSYLLTEEVSSLESQVRALQAELAGVVCERDSLKEDMVQLRTAKKVSDLGWRDERQRSQDLERRLSSHEACEADDHAYDMGLLKQRAARMEAKLQAATTLATQQQQQRQELEAELATTRQQLAIMAEVHSTSSRASGDQGQAAAAAADSTAASSAAMQKLLLESNQGLTSELTATRAQLAAAQAELQQLRLGQDQALREAQEELANMRRQASRVNKELIHKSNRVHDLEELVEQTSAALLVSQAAVMQLQHDKTSGMELVRQEAEEQMKELGALVKRLEGQLEEQDVALRQSAREKLELMEELSATEQQLEGLQGHANDLKIRLAHATQEKVAALLQLAGRAALDADEPPPAAAAAAAGSGAGGSGRGWGVPAAQPPATGAARGAAGTWAGGNSLGASAFLHGSSSSRLPKLQQLPSTLWSRLVQKQAVLRQHLGGGAGGGGEDQQQQQVQPQQQRVWYKGHGQQEEGQEELAWVMLKSSQQQQQQQQMQPGDQLQQGSTDHGQEGHGEGSELRLRLQKAAAVIQQCKTSLGGLARAGAPPAVAAAAGGAVSRGQEDGAAQPLRLTFGSKGHMSQLHEELQQRWRRMGLSAPEVAVGVAAAGSDLHAGSSGRSSGIRPGAFPSSSSPQQRTSSSSSQPALADNSSVPVAGATAAAGQGGSSRQGGNQGSTCSATSAGGEALCVAEGTTTRLGAPGVTSAQPAPDIGLVPGQGLAESAISSCTGGSRRPADELDTRLHTCCSTTSPSSSNSGAQGHVSKGPEAAAAAVAALRLPEPAGTSEAPSSPPPGAVEVEGVGSSSSSSSREAGGADAPECPATPGKHTAAACRVGPGAQGCGSCLSSNSNSSSRQGSPLSSSSSSPLGRLGTSRLGRGGQQQQQQQEESTGGSRLEGASTGASPLNDSEEGLEQDGGATQEHRLGEGVGAAAGSAGGGCSRSTIGAPPAAAGDRGEPQEERARQQDCS